MTDLPRKAVARTARLAALPLGYAGRTAWGLGKRLGGAPAEQVLSDVQQKTAEQLFRTLGELKGGAMKFGQALSVLEAALPDSAMAPYRQHLTKLQDSAPPMAPAVVREQLSAAFGWRWHEQLVWLNDEPSASASIGQVHFGRWRKADGDEIEVAVKVQYPGADKALLGDIKQLSTVARGLAGLFPGIDVKALVREIEERASEELDYHLEAEAQQAFADAYLDDPEVVVPRVIAVADRVLISEWLETPYSLAQVIATGSQAERDHYGELLVRFLFSGPSRTQMLHADPHPGNFRAVLDEHGNPSKLGVLDFGAVARLPGGLPEAMGRLISVAAHADPDALLDGLREEGFVRPGIEVDPELVLTYLAPFVEPTQTESFTFTRDWMREQFQRINDPKSETFTLATKLNLPPAYVLIHRTWLGGIGLLSQLEAEAPFRAILTEHLPGFTPSELDR